MDSPWRNEPFSWSTPFPRTLIVEDIPAEAMGYVKALTDVTDAPIQFHEDAIRIVDTLGAAKEALRSNVYHLVLIDIELKNDDESKSGKQGIELEKWLRTNFDEVDSILRVVISKSLELQEMLQNNYSLSFTNDNDFSQTKEGLRIEGTLYFHKYWLDTSSLRKRIIKELGRRAGINGGAFNTQIVAGYGANLTSIFRKLSRKVASRSTDTKMDVKALESRIPQETFDLLRQLLASPTLQSIQCNAIDQGLSAATVLRVTPSYESGDDDSVIVKIGPKQAIFEEYNRYMEHVFNKPGRMKERRPLLQRTGETLHLAGITYTNLSQHKSFEDFYTAREFSDIEKVLDDLTALCWDAWYHEAKRKPLKLQNAYFEYLNLNYARLVNDWEQDGATVVRGPLRYLEEVWPTQLSLRGQPCVSLDSFSDELLQLLASQNGGPVSKIPNPVEILQHQSFSLLGPAVCCSITHGDFNANNILIKVKNEESFETYLIDFARTQDSTHMVRDLIQLETVVKYVLLTLPEDGETDPNQVQNAVLLRLQMETLLQRQRQWEDIEAIKPKASTLHPSLQKAFLTVCKIRELARDIVFRKSTQPRFSQETFAESYTMGLFYCTLNMVKFVGDDRSDLALTKAMHAFLSAGLLARRIAQDCGIDTPC